MQYTNPIILADYSDPDVIRVGGDFFMVSSSFNYVPGVPILHSKNLVEWEIINYVMPKIPFSRFDNVIHGAGAWAPSIRYNNGKYYCLIPFPDEGIFVSETSDPWGEWSSLRPLLLGSGYEDPCPIWLDGKCYVVFGFVRSRIGFNSKLAIFETDELLQSKANEYKIIYDKPNISPLIEGPKFNKHGEYIYILAPAGGVASGWQVALRSKEIYGDYETKIIMVQGGTDINGPHQGALVDLDDSGNSWAFVHFQQKGVFGRVVHLQPAKWCDDWVICGKETYDNLAGNPVYGGEYPVNIKTDAIIDPSDDFLDKLSLVWQTPANRKDDFFEVKNGLKLNCIYSDTHSFAEIPQLLTQKIQYYNFTVTAKCKLNLIEDGDEVGFVCFGKEYAYICVTKRKGKNYLEYRLGKIGENDKTVESIEFEKDEITFKMMAKYQYGDNLSIKFDGFKHNFNATPGVWVGTRIGVYAKGDKDSKGFATLAYFKVKNND